MKYLLRHRIWSSAEHPREAFARIAYLAAIVFAAALYGWADVVAAYWLVPLVTTQAWIGMIAELLEHYPLIETAPREDIHLSWNRLPGPMERFLLGEMKGEGFHLVHHLFPFVPLWRLEEVDGILANDPAYTGLQRLGGSLPALRSILSALPVKYAPRLGD